MNILCTISISIYWCFVSYSSKYIVIMLNVQAKWVWYIKMRVCREILFIFYIMSAVLTYSKLHIFA